MLYPKQSQTREVMSLNGLWNFKIDKDNIGKNEKWYQKKAGRSRSHGCPC